MAVGGLSILIGHFSLFRQQVSQHDGISSFSIVMMACSFENVLKSKPQQYSACSISKIFRRKSWDFLQSMRNRLIRWTFKARAESASVFSRCSVFFQRVSTKALGKSQIMKYILLLYCHFTAEEQFDRTSSTS